MRAREGSTPRKPAVSGEPALSRDSGLAVNGISALIACLGFAAALALSVASVDAIEPYAVGGLGLMLGAWVLVAARQPGVAIALWVVAYANMIPFFDTQAVRVPGALRPEDLLVLALVVQAGFLGRLHRASWRSVSWRRSLWLLVIAMVAWWTFVLLRTVMLTDVPLRYATAYGRDLLYVALVAAAVALTLRNSRDALLATRVLAGVAALFALGFVLSIVVGADPSWIAHPYGVVEVPGQTRYYVWGHLVTAMSLPVAFWAVFAARGWRRWLWASATILIALQVAVALWRASYIGTALALAITIFLAGSLPGYHNMRRWAAGLVVVAGAAGAAIALALSLGSTVGIARVLPGAFVRIETLGSLLSGGRIVNFDYRLALIRDLLRVLGGDWLWGLGFLHPAIQPVSGLPFGGAIRNTDVSFSMILMPMGAVGLLLFLALYVWALASAIRAVGTVLGPGQGAALLGAVGAMACVVIAGVTLVYWSWPVAAAVAVATLALADTGESGEASSAETRSP